MIKFKVPPFILNHSFPQDSERTMMNEKEISGKLMEGIDCAMVTLHESADAVGMPRDEAYRLASCFGMGMMQGSVCGAVTAGFIAIGYKYGNIKPLDLDSRGLLMAKREEFLSEFKKRFGDDITCPGLLKLDLRNEEDAMKAMGSGIMFAFCPKICRQAADIINEILR